MDEIEILDQIRAALAPQYDVERVLGHGGMGMVVLARDRALDRAVAIKVISPDINVTPRHRQRFLQEARIVAKLRHPNIVAVYAAGEADGLLYFVMEFVPGESLRDLLSRNRCCDSGRAERILIDLADALAFAHVRGVVHRDIKPENVLLDHDTGRAMLADFGVAQALAARAEERLTGPGVVVGSPQYMSPEQAAGERDLDGRSDIYALGLVGYEMLAGESAFPGDSVVAVLTKQLTEPPPPLGPRAPGASSTLVDAITRALEKDANDRWQAAGEMARAIAGEAPVAPEPSAESPITVSPSSKAAPPPAARPVPAAPYVDRPPPRTFVDLGRPHPRAGRARRIATWLAGISAVVILAAPLAWVVWPRPGATAAASPRSTFLVVPFDVQSSDTALARLHDESVRMLTPGLAAPPDVDVIDYNRSIDLVRQARLDTAHAIGLPDALQIARRAGARTVVLGQILADADSLTAIASAYDVSSGQLVAQVRRAGPAGTDPRGVFAALARDILDMTRARPVGSGVAAPPPTRSRQ